MIDQGVAAGIPHEHVHASPGQLRQPLLEYVREIRVIEHVAQKHNIPVPEVAANDVIRWRIHIYLVQIAVQLYRF